MSEFDAIFVGAGHNSLACAAHLALKGWKTIIFERNQTIGGAVRTGEYTLPGFRHDFGAMNLSLFAGSAFHRKYANELKSHGLEFAPVADCFASAFPDGKWFGVSNDLEKTASRLAAFSAADAAAWRRLVGAFPGEAEHLFRLLGSPMSARALAGTVWNLWRKKGLAGALDTGRLLLSSPRAWLEENFETPHVRTTLAVWGMHLDFAPDIAGGALFPYLESMANQSFGMVLGKGGADTITRALAGMVNATGGKIVTGADVAEITIVGGRATGVRLAPGDFHVASKAVIAGVAPGALAGKLLPDGSGDAGFDVAMKTFRHAPGTMMVHLALDDLPDWSAGAELRQFAYVHLAPSLDAMSRTYQQAIAGILPDQPVLVVGQPTAVDPSRAPERKHVLWVQVRMLPAEILGDAAGKIAPGRWDAVKDAYAERVLDIIESYAPGLRRKILDRAIFSPLDLERENPNLVGGDQICGSHHLAQNFLFRPARSFARWNTPVSNLYLTGAATWPGAGTGAGSGFMLAQHLGGN
ncbi:MAG: NAD(P)/FAD-dependent oxidoreductase [Mesorhizobium sp.]|uniref:phytoene desaturase family protein n=1 Tax=Mesorhizobium sp. TaxID=1871066 RepID=UPI000FE390ED|nr:NAD(P)/FAD-dependent oxidoreductase [Mesorhizobium sp.]RWG87783.1 MAG: NAD(P)/FAD-dependent oxidoreductase [Mesorhizobium sp.]RWK12710.1 MAG: NAD(P)/FAD-dependent oxidoreductase [Mesorhizobium sp.]RWK26311.1 MAG: NAD(P)/FAD-dependent oxidoreductase [Mesorhizobium sp.]RWK36958.1 MAG: NAD(P)/FAD-dependent oxidoreductase [Mesorhizobium sp.]TIQ46997.1 MAG: NAD(P)/FAD-dependent oxidoreductase [Mesorhizobium sp.]